MFMHSTIKAPGSDRPSWLAFWSFGWSLAFDQFLQVDPLALGLSKERRPSLGREIPYDDTDEEGEDDHSAHEIVD